MYNIQYSSSGAKDSHNSFTSREKKFCFYFWSKNMALGLPCFHDVNN